MRTRLPFLLTCAALVAALAAPSTSSAGVLCSYSPATYAMTITMTSASDSAKVSRLGSAILVNGQFCQGLPSVGNTGSIIWNDTSGGGTTATVDLTSGHIGPAKFINIGDPSSSIPMTVNAGAGVDSFRVIGSTANETFAFGHGAVDDVANLDAAAELANPDPDVQLNGIESVAVDGGDGADTITAQGGFGTPAGLFGGRFTVNGQGGGDTITGGSGSSIMNGGLGDDTLKGGAGTTDSLLYADAPAGVRVDLAKVGPQDTGGAGVDGVSGFENLQGSGYDDVLSGDDGKNAIMGLGGTDTVMGRGGDDLLLGNSLLSDPAQLDTLSYEDPSSGVTAGVAVSLLDLPDAIIATGSEGSDRINGFANVTGSPYADTITGNAGPNRIDAGGGADAVSAGAGPDNLLLRDGVGDSADCGDDGDAVTADAEGVDTLTGCEQALFAPVPVPLRVPDDRPADVPPPPRDTSLTLNLAAAKRQRLSRKDTLGASLTCPSEPCSARVATTIVIAGRTRSAKVVTLRGVKASVSLVAGRKRTVSLRMSAKVLARVRSALRAGRRVTVTLKATAKDAAGNVRTATRIIVVRR
jgi:Ca2+-binding RTX toxin-like protein